jgi:transglutaminase-like putative cysteine protease
MTMTDGAPRRTYRVHHRTEYAYDDDVTTSYGRAFLRPVSDDRQWCLWSRLEVEPAARTVTEHVDHFGNASSYLEVTTPHRDLTVTSTSVVEVVDAAPDLDALDGRWTVGSAAEAVLQADPVTARGFTLPSPLVPDHAEVRAYARTILEPDRPLGAALAALVGAVHRDFTYRSGATSVSTTLPELLEGRVGVCQDFAHLAVGCLRAAGLPARYVSGYLETTPPPGRPRLHGADASHAWAEVLVPGGAWVGLDPTNDQPADGRYVVTAVGRDYSDVPPLKGVIFTESTSSTMNVAVDVVRVDGDDAGGG